MRHQPAGEVKIAFANDEDEGARPRAQSGRLQEFGRRRHILQRENAANAVVVAKDGTAEVGRIKPVVVAVDPLAAVALPCLLQKCRRNIRSVDGQALEAGMAAKRPISAADIENPADPPLQKCSGERRVDKAAFRAIADWACTVSKASAAALIPSALVTVPSQPPALRENRNASLWSNQARCRQ